MAFGVNSKIFDKYIEDKINAVTLMNLLSDTVKVTLMGNSVDGTVTQGDTSAHNAYNGSGGQWLTTAGYEVVNTNGGATGTPWVAGGLPLTSVASSVNVSTHVYTFTAATRPGGTGETITNAYGCLIYDFTIATPVAKQGICYLAFGGANGTTGTFTVAFNASGIFTLTL